MNKKASNFIRFDGNSPDLASSMRLRNVQRHCDVEYRQTTDGNWAVRTIPKDDDEIPLAGIGKSLHEASGRLLNVVNFSRDVLQGLSENGSNAAT